MAESKEELKSLLMKVKAEGEKPGLKLNIQKMKIMASGPITSWQIDEETMETVINYIFLGCKITADGECSHEIKRHLLPGRKGMTNLDSIFLGCNCLWSFELFVSGWLYLLRSGKFSAIIPLNKLLPPFLSLLFLDFNTVCLFPWWCTIGSVCFLHSFCCFHSFLSLFRLL